ncbi:MAG: hypothetical protein ACMUIA_09835 [bacterium]
MEASKKFLLFIVVISIIPLLLIFTFFAFRFKAEKTSTQYPFRQGVEKKANSSREIQALELAMEKLADYPLLWQYLDQINQASAEREEFDLLEKEEAICRHMEEFKSQYPAFEEIMVKSPSEGKYLLKVPAGASGEDRPGSHLVIVTPIPHPDTDTPALLLGFAKITPALWPEVTGGRLMDGSRKKLVLFFIWFFLFVSILIPLVMFFTLRQMKRRLASALPRHTPRGSQTKEADGPEHFPGRESDG